MICNSFEKIDFLPLIKSEDFEAKYHPDYPNIDLESAYEFRFGFVYSRLMSRDNTEEIYFPNTLEKMSTIYLEKKGDEVALCLKDLPCFP